MTDSRSQLKPKVYIGPGDDPVVSQAVASAGGECVDNPGEADSLVWLSPSMPDLEAALHPGVRWVQLKSAGIDHVIRSGLVDTTRIWTCARGAYTDEVAEHGLMLMLAAARRLHEIIPDRRWGEPGARFGRVFAGSKVTILGSGAIGQALIALMEPFGVHITAVTRSGREVLGADISLHTAETDAALADSDFVVLAAPSTPETVGMIDKRRLGLMSTGAWLVNIGRGDLVDTDDLVEALRERVIAGAALDVTDPQPLPDGHPLWGLPNAIITPHTSNPPAANSRTLASRVAENLERLQNGEQMEGLIDPERGY